MSADPKAVQAGNRGTVIRLTALVLGMFAFGFALAPLYNLYCKATGAPTVENRMESLGTRHAASGAVIEDRLVTVRFDVTINPDLPWDLVPETRKMQVHPGQVYRVNFQARNRSGHDVRGQAIPNLVPWQATNFFTKQECFCFTQQELKGNEEKPMPLQFVVLPDLPDDIDSITLSYTVMKLPDPDPAPHTAALVSTTE